MTLIDLGILTVSIINHFLRMCVGLSRSTVMLPRVKQENGTVSDLMWIVTDKMCKLFDNFWTACAQINQFINVLIVSLFQYSSS